MFEWAMKKRDLFILSAIVVATTSCATNTGTGALAGGALGAGAGALIGGGQGAVIGGAVGAITGGLIGNAIDANQRAELEQNSPHTLRKIDKEQQLSMDDIIALSQAGVEPDVINNMIDKTHSRFTLTSAQVIRLKNAGVSEKVINHMIDT